MWEKHVVLAQTQYADTYKVWNTATGACVAILTGRRAADMLIQALISNGGDSYALTGGNVCSCPEEEDV